MSIVDKFEVNLLENWGINFPPPKQQLPSEIIH